MKSEVPKLLYSVYLRMSREVVKVDKDDVARVLTERILEQCRQHDISPNRLFLDCHLHKSILDNLKRGSIPSVEKIMLIADFFHVSVDYLIGR